MKKPRRTQVRDETMKLLIAQGITGWRVRFNPRMTRALGRCIYGRKTIEYQPKYMDENTLDEVIMTIRHEVAHASVASYHGHDSVWRAKCIELGGNGKRYNNTANLSRKFTGTCPTCKREIQKDRRTQQACGKCCGGTYEAKHAFVWTRNA